MADERMAELRSRFEQTVCMNRGFAMELAASKKREAALKVELAVVRGKLADETSHSAALTAAREEAGKAREAADAEIAALKVELEKLRVANRIIAEQLAGEKAQTASATKSAQEQVKAVEEEAQRRECDLEARVQELESNLIATSEQLQQAMDANAAYDEAYAQVSQDLKSTSDGLAASKRREVVLQSSVEQCKAELVEMQDAVRGLEARVRAETEKAEAERKKVENLRAQLRQAQEANDEFDKAYEASRKTVESISRELAASKRHEAELKAKLDKTVQVQRGPIGGFLAGKSAAELCRLERAAQQEIAASRIRRSGISRPHLGGSDVIDVS